MFMCKLSVHQKRFRKKSFNGQYEEFALIDAFVIPTNEYLGSMPLWWDGPMQNMIMNIGNTERLVHRITVSLCHPLKHLWTYEDYRKGRCDKNDIDEIELLPSGEPKVYNLISFLVRERIDNETQRWKGRNADIEESFMSVRRWCYLSYNI